MTLNPHLRSVAATNRRTIWSSSTTRTVMLRCEVVNTVRHPSSLYRESQCLFVSPRTLGEGRHEQYFDLHRIIRRLSHAFESFQGCPSGRLRSSTHREPFSNLIANESPRRIRRRSAICYDLRRARRELPLRL